MYLFVHLQNIKTEVLMQTMISENSSHTLREKLALSFNGA